MNEFAVHLYTAIRENEYIVNEILPDALALAKKYNISEEDVKNGIGDLIYEGVLERNPKNCCEVRVKKPYTWDLVTGNHSFTGEAKKRGQTPGNRVVTFEKRKAWPQVIKRLQLQDGENVYVLERLLLADDHKVGLEFSYMPAKYYEGVTREMFEGGQSTFKVMQEKFGLVSDKAVDEISVATLEAREAELLGLDPGVPVLIRFRVTLSSAGTPIKGSRAIYLFSPGYELKI